MTAQAWLNGQWLDAHSARISVYDHGFLYGDGVFEGLRFYSGRIVALAEHVQRLFDSAQALLLPVPWSKPELATIAEQLVARYGQPDGYIRLILTRGEGALGIDPASCARPSLLLIADQISVVPERVKTDGAKLIIASQRRLALDGLDPRIKSLNYLNSVLARIEASQAGADEAILLNSAGRVTEGSADNLFIVRQGQLLTPPAIDGALAGITRQILLQLAADQGIAAREQSLAPYDLYTADECFLSGTGAELIPVKSIDQRPLAQCPGPVFQQLAQAYQQWVRRH